VQCVSMTKMHEVIVVAQDKTWSYTERALGDDFIPLATETYNCFHSRFDSFLASCVHPCIIHH
jgi:hypothetical protein